MMRGRSISRTSNELSESPPSNSSELSAMLNGANQYPQRQQLVRTTSLKLPNKSLYTVPENRNEESVLPNGNQYQHASKLISNRQRSSAASILYNNIMNKRNASNITLEDPKGANTEAKRSSMNVIIRSSRSSSRSRSTGCNNPISHYEVSRNLGTRPKGSSSGISTLDSNAEHLRLQASDGALNVEIVGKRDDSIDFIAEDASVTVEKPGGMNYKHGGKFFPQAKNQTETKKLDQDNLHSESTPKGDNDNRSLETQLETAINGDLFIKNYTFDNKFDDDDDDGVDDDDKHTADEVPSITSSNQSPLTKLPTQVISRKDSMTLENFHNDITKAYNANANSNSTTHVSRLQMKMNALKNKFDSFTSNKEASTDSEDYFSLLRGGSSYSSDQSLLIMASKDKNFPSAYQSDYNKSADQNAAEVRSQVQKFWVRNDLQAKLLIERLNHQLRNIERFPSSGKLGEKIIVARIRHVIEEDLGPKKVSAWKWARLASKGRQTTKEHPVLKMGGEQKGLPFEELFEMAKGNSTDEFDQDEMHCIEDTDLKNKIKEGKFLMGQLWRDSEIYELSGTAIINPMDGSQSSSDSKSVPSDHSPQSASTGNTLHRIPRLSHDRMDSLYSR